MKALLLLLAALPAGAAAVAGEPYWFKTYSTAPYKEFWTGELVVKDLAKDLPKALAAVEKEGGALTQPLSTFASSKADHVQQLSFTLPGKGAKKLLNDLRRLGTLDQPAVRAAGAPIPLAEVEAKIDVIMKEKTGHAAELAKVPAAAAAQEEILEHLLLVEEVAKRADSEVRFNLQVSQRVSPK